MNKSKRARKRRFGRKRQSYKQLFMELLEDRRMLAVGGGPQFDVSFIDGDDSGDPIFIRLDGTTADDNYAAINLQGSIVFFDGATLIGTFSTGAIADFVGLVNELEKVSNPAGGNNFFGGVWMNGNGGDDTLDCSGLTQHPAKLMGGPGNDTLLGGSKVDVLDGGDGVDTIVEGDSDGLEPIFVFDTSLTDQNAPQGDPIFVRLEGTNTDDSFVVTESSAGDLEFFSGATSIGTFSAGEIASFVGLMNLLEISSSSGVGNNYFGGVWMNGNAGDDSLDCSGLSEYSAKLEGGEGNDTLKGGDNSDILSGGSGRDELQGGAGRDVIVGGSGANQLFGGSEGDLLVAAKTAYDDEPASLDRIVSEWASARSYEVRIDNLRNGTGPVLSGTNVKLSTGGIEQTVFWDHQTDTVDTLEGIRDSLGRDWFIISQSGESAGSEPEEEVDRTTIVYDESATTNTVEIDDWITAIADLPPRSEQEPSIVIRLTLENGTYGPRNKINVPLGFVLFITGANGTEEFRGSSPALILESGTLIISNTNPDAELLITNDTPAPSIRVEGGHLTLRGIVIHETTATDAAYAAIEVMGGVLDVGTTDQPGGNTFIVHGPGSFFDNRGTAPLLAIGNTYRVEETVVFTADDPVLVGTAADEHISFESGAIEGQILVSATGLASQSVSTPGQLVAYGGDGNDTLQVAGDILQTAWLYGQGGNDKIRGGGGDDVLMGGPGDDLLVGKRGHDFLVGGRGADRIIGNADDDMLMAGYLGFREDAIQEILRRWAVDGEMEARRSAVLEYMEEQKLFVYNDGDRDILTGSAGSDWFFASLDGNGVLDKITDLADEVYSADLEFILGDE